MKFPFIRVCFALCLAPHCGWADDPTAGKPLNFLFLGNSFTFRHDMPHIFKTLAGEGSPVQSIKPEVVAYGGRDLFRHYELYKSQDLLCLASLTDAQLREAIDGLHRLARSDTPEPAYYTEYRRNVAASAVAAQTKPTTWTQDQSVIHLAVRHHEDWINKRSAYPATWDYVVLQSWHDVSANPEIGYIKYATRFAQLAKERGTKPILYVTAPYSQNETRVTEPMEPASALKEMRIVSDLARKLGAIVVPVPLAVYRLQKAGAPFTLRYVKDGHPNQVCAYLTACLFYAAVFNKSPEGLALSEVADTKIADPAHPDRDPDGHPLKRVFNEAERALLQRTAWETVQAFRRGDFPSP